MTIDRLPIDINDPRMVRCMPLVPAKFARRRRYIAEAMVRLEADSLAALARAGAYRLLCQRGLSLRAIREIWGVGFLRRGTTRRAVKAARWEANARAALTAGAYL